MCDHSIEQYFPVVLFIRLYKVIQTFESVDDILKCDHSNESYGAVLSCTSVYYTVQDGSNFWVCSWNLNWRIQMKAIEQYHRFRIRLTFFYSYAGRAPSASTATGNKHHHISEQEDLINQALE